MSNLEQPTTYVVTQFWQNTMAMWKNIIKGLLRFYQTLFSQIILTKFRATLLAKSNNYSQLNISYITTEN